MPIRACLAAAALALAACSPSTPSAPVEPPTPATWSVSGPDSRVSFVTVKAGEIAEVHHFEGLSGTVGADGKAVVEIPLDEVKTAIDIRDQRMRDILFETAKFPKATITAQLDLAGLGALAPGARQTLALPITVELHGASAQVEADFYVTRIGADRVLVETVEPIVVDAAAFGLLPGLAELQKIANLPSITPAAPVTASLLFVGATES